MARLPAQRTTTAPAVAQRRTVEPGELVGSQTTPSGRSVIAAGSVIAPRSVPTVTGSPSDTARSAAVALEIRATGGAGGAGQVLVAVGQAAQVEQVVPGGQHGLALPGRTVGAGAGRGRRPAVPWVAGSAASSARIAAGRRVPN